MIRLWIAASLPGIPYDVFAKTTGYLSGVKQTQCPGEGEMCLWKYIANADLETAWPLAEVTKNYNPSLWRNVEWLLYTASRLRELLPVVSPKLAAIKLQYASKFSPSSVTPSSSTHCVVHYRVGDLVKWAQAMDVNNKSVILHPMSFAAAVASFSPRPTTVEILEGGASHFDTRAIDGSISNKTISTDIDKVTLANKMKSFAFLQRVKHAIEEQLPDALVTFSSGTADEDWYKLSQASKAVIAVGSFAHTAVMAGTNNQVRSPASSSLDFASRDLEQPMQIREGWETYPYEYFELSEW